MSTTPFHGIADELRRLADRVSTLGDAVHTGTYEVPEPVDAAAAAPDKLAKAQAKS